MRRSLSTNWIILIVSLYAALSIGCHGWFLPSDSRSNAALSFFAASSHAVRIAAFRSAGRLVSIAVGELMIRSDFRMMRKSDFCIGLPSGFFSMPLVSMRVRLESSSAFHQLAQTSTVPCASAITAFSWLPVTSTLPK